MYKVRCGSFITHHNVVLQYIGKDFRPEMPINASSCRCMFALHGRHFAADVLDFSNFNTENIVDMAYMFNGFYKCKRDVYKRQHVVCLATAMCLST